MQGDYMQLIKYIDIRPRFKYIDIRPRFITFCHMNYNTFHSIPVSYVLTPNNILL